MNKINIGTSVFIYPIPVALMGVTVEGRANFMTVGWISRVNLTPPMLGASINKIHYTAQGVRESKAFSLNFPSQDMVEKTDYCGLVSGRKTDKSKVFELFYSESGIAPMISQCPLCIECRLVQTVSLATNDLFLGEITGAYSEPQYLTDGNLDIQKMSPLLLTMPDNNYWTVGRNAGQAWSVGNRLKERK
jgi:flavin reductase (DIM6/NTAB) family NADH-FMN oxidoreductase RutF